MSERTTKNSRRSLPIDFSSGNKCKAIICCSWLAFLISCGFPIDFQLQRVFKTTWSELVFQILQTCRVQFITVVNHFGLCLSVKSKAVKNRIEMKHFSLSTFLVISLAAGCYANPKPNHSPSDPYNPITYNPPRPLGTCPTKFGYHSVFLPDKFYCG